MGSLSTSREPEAKAKANTAERRSSLAYYALLVFSFLYFARPEDLLPGLSYIPFGKITGGIALLALIFGVRGHRAVKKIPIEVKLLIALLFWLILTIPFAWWRGGAFDTVFNRFSKSVIVAALVSLLVTRMSELRKLLFVQAFCLALMTVVSIALYRQQGRMGGVLGGVFENPNDLAINIALNWPLAFAFLLLAKGLFRKLFWAGAMFVMLVGVVLTYSRSGFLAIILCAIICLYQFGFKGKRMYLVGGAAFGLLILMIAAPFFGLYPKIWATRMTSIVTTDLENTYDNGSREARQELLKESLGYMTTHPIFGVGPGNFASVSGTWRVAHNTYTELGAEAGLPALALFLLVLYQAFKNLRKVAKSPAYKTDTEIKVLAGAMWASFGAYLVAAAFSDTQYELFPYFMVAYTTALYHLACVIPRREEPLPTDGKPRTSSFDRYYGRSRKPELAGTR